MNTANFFQLIPDFLQGIHAVRGQLLIAAIAIAFGGFAVHLYHAQIQSNHNVAINAMVRMLLVVLTIFFIQDWGDTMVLAINSFNEALGTAGSGTNILEDVQQATARKLGTAAATQNLNQGISGLDTGQAGGFPQAGDGIKITDYAYPGDTTPDPNSAKGSGAFPFSSAPGSLIPNYSAALTDAAAARLGLKPGQTFTVTSTTGQVYSLRYDDRAPETDDRIDIYSPGGELGGNNFEQIASSVNAGPQGAGPGALAAMQPPVQNVGDFIVWAVALILSWVASAIMWGAQIASQILYLCEMAISPAFIAFLMIPALAHLATRFLLTFVSLTLWPLAWAIGNLVTKILIDLSINPTGNAALGGANVAGLVTGPLSGLGYFIGAACWIIFYTISAPLFIQYLFHLGGGTATAMMLGGAAAAAQRVGNTAANVATGSVAGPVSAAAHAFTPTQRYARSGQANP